MRIRVWPDARAMGHAGAVLRRVLPAFTNDVVAISESDKFSQWATGWRQQFVHVWRADLRSRRFQQWCRQTENCPVAPHRAAVDNPANALTPGRDCRPLLCR